MIESIKRRGDVAEAATVTFSRQEEEVWLTRDELVLGGFRQPDVVLSGSRV